MNVGIIGTGYVGLITGVGLANKGHVVTCFDKEDHIIKSLNNGHPHFFEEGLAQMLVSAVEKGNLTAKNIQDIDLRNFDVVIIAVGTPSENGKIHLGFIEEAAEIIGSALKTTPNFVAVIVKSTVVPGTTDTFVRKILTERSGKKLGEFGLGMNPEFLREGNAVTDFMYPDRIVFGHEDPGTLKLMQTLYAPWECEKIVVNTRTAEMIKYANNCLLATQISAANELANIAAAIGNIDILEVIGGVSADKRWSPILNDGKRIQPEILSYLIPGPGFGGSCFVKDLKALEKKADEVGVTPRVIKSVLETNETQPFEIIKILENKLGDLKGKRVLILGVAFKAGTDDVRESISLKILHTLSVKKADILLHDPVAIGNAKKYARIKEGAHIEFIENWEDRLSDVDAIVLVTNWQEYKKLDEKYCKQRINGKVFIDTRRFFQPSDFDNCLYCTIGFTKN